MCLNENLLRVLKKIKRCDGKMECKQCQTMFSDKCLFDKHKKICSSSGMSIILRNNSKSEVFILDTDFNVLNGTSQYNYIQSIHHMIQAKVRNSIFENIQNMLIKKSDNSLKSISSLVVHNRIYIFENDAMKFGKSPGYYTPPSKIK